MKPAINSLILNLKNHVSLTPEQIDLISSKFKSRVLVKKEFLLHKGNTCKYFNYVFSGCLRVYGMDANGFIHINYFAPEDWWAVDLKSFLKKVPSRFYIDALEESQILQISQEDFEIIMESIPQLEKWLRILLQNALITAEDRVATELSMLAEERYQAFLSKYPQLEKRIPQKQIASFLGITPEFLSMLRKKRKKLKGS